MLTKSFRSAVVVIPPKNLWDPIQKIRKEHDKAYETWMPHINLLFPFVHYDQKGQNFLAEAKLIQSEFPQTIKPFKVCFTQDSIQYFNQGARCTVHVRPFVAVNDDTISNDESEDDEPDPTTKIRAEMNRVTPPPKSLADYMEPAPAAKKPPLDLLGSNSRHPTDETVNVTIIQILPEPPVPEQFRNLPPASLSSLKDAIWNDDHIHEDQAWRINVEENLKNQRKQQQVVTRNVRVQQPVYYQPASNYSTEDGNTQEKDNPWVIFEGDDQMLENMETDSNDYNPNDFSVISKKHRRKPVKAKTPPPAKTVTQGVHPQLKELYDYLAKLYPDLIDQTKKSKGFVPHLTLGQCDSHNVHKFISNIKKDWVDMQFWVKEIYLISRGVSDDPQSTAEPHKIRNMIKLPV